MYDLRLKRNGWSGDTSLEENKGRRKKEVGAKGNETPLGYLFHAFFCNFLRRPESVIQLLPRKESMSLCGHFIQQSVNMSDDPVTLSNMQIHSKPLHGGCQERASAPKTERSPPFSQENRCKFRARCKLAVICWFHSHRHSTGK